MNIFQHYTAILIVLGALLLSPLWPTSVLAMSAQQNERGACQVLLNRNLQQWSQVSTTTFIDCAVATSRSGHFDVEGWALGFWVGNQVSVNRSGEVYFKKPYEQTWQYWGNLFGNRGGNQTNTQDGDGDGIANSADRCPSQSEVINNFADQDGCPDSLEELVALAQQDIDAFWRQTFTDYGWEYRPPRYFQAYNGRTATSTETGCGTAIPNNALYCPNSHGIFYDVDFLYTYLLDYGDYVPVLIIAHEWGHAMQHVLMGHEHHERASIAKELEADCLAGAYTRHAEQVSQLLEEGDIEEGAANLFDSGDNLPWFDPRAHGSPQQRVSAFANGLEQGIGACLAVEGTDSGNNSTVTVTLFNESSASVCYVYISPTTADSWGDDWLGSTEVLGSGEQREFQIQPGAYDLLAENCNHDEIDKMHNVDLFSSKTWRIQ